MVQAEQLPIDPTQPGDSSPAIVESKADRVRAALTTDPHGSTRDIASSAGVSERYVRMIRAERGQG